MVENTLDWTTQDLPLSGDDSLQKDIKKFRPKRLSKVTSNRGNSNLSKIRKMLGKNVSMNKRKEKNGENNRAAQMRKLVAALSKSPSGRRAFSNPRERPSITQAEIKPSTNRNRPFSPNTRTIRGNSSGNDMLQRLGHKINSLLKKPSSKNTKKANPKSSKPVKALNLKGIDQNTDLGNFDGVSD